METLVCSSGVDEIELIEDADGTWFDLLRLADGTRSPAAITAELVACGHPLDLEAVRDGIAEAAAAGFLVDDRPLVGDPLANIRAWLEHELGDRDRRDHALAAISASTVALVGGGGVGSWVALDLALSGVGRVIVIDADRVERRNLTRQPFTDGDIGAWKVDAIGRMVRERRPQAAYVGVRHLVERPDDLTSLTDGADVVLACGDQPSYAAVCTLVARSCVPRGIPHIGAAYGGATARVGPTWVPRRRTPVPCTECAAIETAGAVVRGPVTPVTVTHAQASAALAVSEALRCIAGLRPAALGRVSVLDLSRLRMVATKVRRHGDCVACGASVFPRPRAGRATSTRGEGVIR